MNSRSIPLKTARDLRVEHSTTHILLCVVALILGFHLLALGIYPLLGTTEGRYGEMARKMVLTGQYLVPMFTDTAPFWGKPPLSMWLSALSMNLFGINEFAARLPSWLASVGSGLLIMKLLAPNTRVALIAFLVWASCYLGYSAFGKVHTDSVLTFCVTLSLVGLYLGHFKQKAFWHYAAYFGIGLALLAKGPVVLIYVGLPWVIWIVLQRQFLAYATSTTTWLGITLALVVAVPWYVAAESAHPGFLNYFLFGEHFQRFLDSGWSGDLYGAGHDETPGTIVLFLVESLLPWSLLLPVLYVFSKQRHHLWNSAPTAFLLTWAVTPVVFFCFSANVVPNYVMPTLPAWAALFAVTLAPLFKKRRQAIALAFVAALFPLVKLIQNANPELAYDEPRNQQALVNKYLATNPGTTPLFFAGKRLYAAEFYLSNIHYVTEARSLPAHGSYYLTMRTGREPFAAPRQCQEQPMTNNYRFFYCEPS